VTPASDHPERLLWYATGALDPEEARQIEAHLAVCSECVEELARFRSLSETMRHRQFVDRSHVGVEDLVAYDADPKGMEPSTRALIDRHLQGCADCREDVESLRAAGREMGARVPPPLRPMSAASLRAGRAGLRWMGLAAVLAVALAGAAAVWWTLRPEPSRITLLPALRGGDETVILTGAGPWPVTVVLPFDAADGPYLMALTDPDGATVSMGGQASVSASDGQLDLLLPPLSRPGRYQLAVRQGHDLEAVPSLYLFRVSAAAGRPAPSAP